MVEQVEHFPAKLNQLGFSQLRSLNNREVGVVEPWSNHDVATQTAEVAHGYDERVDIEPAIRRAENVDWTSHVRSQSIVGTRERRVINDDVHRITSLRLYDRTELPALLELIAMERHLVDSTEHEAM